MCYCNGYSGLAIADFFIEKAISMKKEITNLHVLKIIYFAQAFSYPSLNRRLIKDEFYAWRFGPVEVHTYEEFKTYGSSRITSPSGKTTEELEDIKSRPEIVSYLDQFCSLFDVSINKLISLTHVSGGPWYVTPMYNVIDYGKIVSYYGRPRQ